MPLPDELQDLLPVLRRVRGTVLAHGGYLLWSNGQVSTAAGQAHSTIAYRLYEAGDLPDDEVLFADLEALLDAYEAYMSSDLRRTLVESPAVPATTEDPDPPPQPSTHFELAAGFQELRDRIQAEGFTSYWL